MAHTVVWKAIPSTDGMYEANEFGEIRNAKTCRILHQYDSASGYKILMLAGKRNARVHQLVAEAFLGERAKGLVVNHKDGNKANNKSSNLEYVTSSENNLHALRTGLRRPCSMKGKARRGEQNHFAKLSENDVLDVLLLRNETGWGARKISSALGLPRGAVTHIISGNSWKHLQKGGM